MHGHHGHQIDAVGYRQSMGTERDMMSAEDWIHLIFGLTLWTFAGAMILGALHVL